MSSDENNLYAYSGSDKVAIDALKVRD